MKKCSGCGLEKPLSEFYKHDAYSGNYTSMCKSCLAEYHKTPTMRKKQRACRLKLRFGMTVEQYDEIFETQNGVCAICGQPEIVKNRYGWARLSVDHDHKTGEIRGLLCQKCNSALGFVNENIPVLQSMINYLGRFK